MNIDPTAAIRELDDAWAAAETAGDTAALHALSVEDFGLVGPHGFILDKTAWLQRYSSGQLRTNSLDWVVESVRVYGDCAVAIGTQTQTGEYSGQPIDGAFRSTHVAVHQGGRWKLASIQLSPIHQSPPPTEAS
jgi:ketosteroid isomerase-like protein